MKTKRKTIAHAVERGKERIHPDFNESDFWSIVNRIRRNEAPVIQECRGLCTAFFIQTQGKKVIAMYHNRMKLVLTFLPMNSYLR